MWLRIKLYALLCYCSMLGSTAALTHYGRCRTPSRERAFCIELRDCRYFYELIQSPNLSASDRSYLSSSQCGYANQQVLICCPERFIDTAPAPAAAPVIPTSTKVQQPATNSNMRTSTGTATLPKPPQCGKVLSNRIYGGNATTIDEFPWMALIEYTKPGNEKGHHCGGTLINNKYVITAAHCVTGSGIPTDWVLSGVRLGEWDTSTNPDCEIDIRGKTDCAPEHLDIAVEERISHPSYGPNIRNQLNDIALLRLAYAITFSDFVRPVCLPIATNLRRIAEVGTKMDVAGWGRTKTTSVSALKLKATVDVWDLEECRRTYTKQNIRLESTQMCAGGAEGIDSCRGDSGGPLVVEESVDRQNYYFLTGVVSFGPTPCGLAGWPGVYTRVADYVDWIQSTIRA